MEVATFTFDDPSEAAIIRNAFRRIGWQSQTVWPRRANYNQGWEPNHDDGGYAFYVAVSPPVCVEEGCNHD